MVRKRSTHSKTEKRGKVDTSRGFGKFLGRPWWTGFGSIVAFIALVVTVWAIEKPSGNSSATNLASAVSIKASWPLSPGCDGSTSVAVFPDGPSPEAVRTSPTTDVRTALAEKGAAFGQGFLYLTFTVTGDAVAQIVNIRPLFYLESHRQPAWIYKEESGCGDTYGRYFSLNLDSRTMADQGIQGIPGLPPGSPQPPTSPLGKSFHVSSTDPAAVIVTANACKAYYYQWGLQITYIVGTHEFVKYIGTQNDPFRSIGPLAHAIPAYTQASPRLMGAGTARQVSGCGVPTT
jgi:hypothetical protein